VERHSDVDARTYRGAPIDALGGVPARDGRFRPSSSATVQTLSRPAPTKWSLRPHGEGAGFHSTGAMLDPAT